MNKRVLILIERLGVGGVETHAGSIASVLSSEFDFYIAGCDGGNVSYYKKNYKEVLPLSDDLSLRISQIEKFIVKNQISMIHVHQYGLFGEALVISNKLNIPFFITLHSFLYPLVGWREQNKVTASYWESVVFKSVSGVAVVSENHKKFWLKNFPVLAGKLVVTRNCIDQNVFAFNPTIGNRHLASLRVEEDKQSALDATIEYVEQLRTLPNHKDATLTVAGDGELLGYYKEKYVAASYIKFIGASNNMPELMNKCDVVVGAGRTALEGIMCGKVVMVFGPWGKNGLLTPENYKLFSESNFNGKNMPTLSTNDVVKTFSNLTLEMKNNIVQKNWELGVKSCGREVIKKEVSALYGLRKSSLPETSDYINVLVAAEKRVVANDKVAVDYEKDLQRILLEKEKAVVELKQVITAKDDALEKIVTSAGWRSLEKIRCVIRGAKNE